MFGRRNRSLRVAVGPGLLGLGLIGAAPLQDDSAEAAACEAAVQASDWNGAVPRCEAALVADPDGFGLHYFLAFAHQGLGAWGPAADAFEAFVAAADDDGDRAERLADEIASARRSAAVARFRSGDLEAALPLLERAAEADATDAETWFWLGVARERSGDAAGAEAAFEAVTREAPEVADAWFLLGRLRYRGDDPQAARTRLERYLEAAPDGAFAAEAHWMAASIALGETGEESSVAAEAASRHFAAYLESAALSSDASGRARAAAAHYFLGGTTSEAGDCDAARAHYEAFLDLAPADDRVAEVRQFLDGGGCSP